MTARGQALVVSREASPLPFALSWEPG